MDNVQDCDSCVNILYYLYKYVEEIWIYQHELEDPTMTKSLGEYLESR
jgi:hypothetical protein